MSAVVVSVVAGGTIVGGGLTYLGAKEQSEAIKDASRTQSKEQKRLLDFQKQVYEEGKPFRDIEMQYAETGAKTLPTLYDYVMNPTISQGALLAAEEGQRLLSQDAATMGSPTSGPAQLAKSDFMARLMASERDRQMNDMFRLAGYGTSAGNTANYATGQAGNLLNTSAQMGTNIANMQVAQGAVQGGLYGTLGNYAMQVPYMYGMYNMMNGSNQMNQPYQEFGWGGYGRR